MRCTAGWSFTATYWTGALDRCFCRGAEFAGPPMISPRISGKLRGRGLRDGGLSPFYGCYFILHYPAILNRYCRILNKLGPMESTPLRHLLWGLHHPRGSRGAWQDIAIIGNIQYDDLRRLSSKRLAVVYNCLRRAEAGLFYHLRRTLRRCDQRSDDCQLYRAD